MNNKNFEESNDILRNIINRICHDIISPLTTIMNGIELIRSRIETTGQNIKNNKQISVNKLLDIVNNSTNQINNQINLFRYLYSPSKKPYNVSTMQFIENLQGFLNEYNLQLIFADHLEEINNFLLQCVTHTIFLFINFFAENSVVLIKLIKDKGLLMINFKINHEEHNHDSDIIKIINELKDPMNVENEEANPINVNQYFFHNLLLQNKITFTYKILDGNNRDFTMKFNAKDIEKFFH